MAINYNDYMRKKPTEQPGTPAVVLQRLVSVRELKPNDSILRADGKFCEIQGSYPAAGTIFVQFKDGMGWHGPEDGRVFIRAR